MHILMVIVKNIPYIIMALLAFSVLVIIHELGHFTLAKLNGVKVEEFSLGMGPKLFGIKGKETEYLIKAFPIGGYVKMIGEEGESADPRAFANKTPLQRLSIVAAGPIMNIILAIVLFAIVGGSKGIPVPIVDQLVNNAPAMMVGIKPGDKIVKVNDKNIKTWDEFTQLFVVSKGEVMKIQLLRDSKVKNVEVKPVKNTKTNRYMIGIAPKESKLNFTESVKYGFNQTGFMVKETFGFFGKLFKGKVSSNEVGGPVTIIKVSGMAAKAGVMNLVLFTAFLSVQLGIFNIIPFPALDGGWICILLFQIITGKKLDDNKVGMINYIGFIILMSLMVLVTLKDIISPVKF